MLSGLLERVHALIRRAYPRHVRNRDERRLNALLGEMLNEAGDDEAGRRRILIRAIADAAKTLPRAWLTELSVGGRSSRRAHSRRRTTEGRTTMHLGTLYDGLNHDVRSALRAIIRRPGSAIFVSVTLALGIGANAAVFSMLHSVLLAPLPYDEPGRLVRMYWSERGEGRGGMSEPAFLDFRDHLTSVRIAAYDNYGGRDFGADIMVEGRAERVRLLGVNGDYFDVLGADMILGRAFSRDDEQEGAAPVAVISERLWRRAMQADPGAVGKTLRLDGVNHRVSGVVSSDLVDPLKGSIDVWLPWHLDPEPWEWDGNNYLTVVGRLSPGVSLARARAEVARRNEVQMQLRRGTTSPGGARWHRCTTSSSARPSRCS